MISFKVLDRHRGQSTIEFLIALIAFLGCMSMIFSVCVLSFSHLACRWWAFQQTQCIARSKSVAGCESKTRKAMESFFPCKQGRLKSHVTSTNITANASCRFLGLNVSGSYLLPAFNYRRTQ